MQREWNPKTFFRRLTPQVATQTSSAIGICEGSARVDLYEAWKLLPLVDQQRVEAELTHVNDMCTPHARAYLLSIAREVWGHTTSFPRSIGKDMSTQDLAMRLFLEHRTAFYRAYKDFAIDSLEHGVEYRSAESRPLAPLQDMKARIAAEFAAQLSDGSSRVFVEDHANDEKLAVFVYYEDEVTPEEQITEGGLLATAWRRPVLQASAIFHFSTGLLQVKSARRAERELLRDCFAEFALGDRGYFQTSANPFSFHPLSEPDFEFATRREDGIDRVSLTSITLEPRHGLVRSLALQFPTGLSLSDVRTVLGGYGLRLEPGMIQGVKLVFQFEGSGRARSRTVSLSQPRISNLNDTARDRLVREYLRAWRIDVAAGSVGAADLQAAA